MPFESGCCSVCGTPIEDLPLARARDAYRLYTDPEDLLACSAVCAAHWSECQALAGLRIHELVPFRGALVLETSHAFLFVVPDEWRPPNGGLS